MKYLFLVLLFVVILTAPAAAQQATTVQGTTPQATTAKVTAEIIATSATTVVKGAPFSAEAISESTQILADGNKISRTFTTRMYRDSDGRFRREEVPSASGNFVGSLQIISIFDPIGNFRLLLDPAKKTARRMSVLAGSREGAVIVNGRPMSPAVRAQVETTAVQRANIVVMPSMALTTTSADSSGKSESLGTRTIEGIEVEGTRTTTTLPAGAIGNERPIEMVYEKWYSKELQLIVYSKHSDPRFGEQIYRLDNISRDEPDASLFNAPADYKLITEPTFNVVAPSGFVTPRPVVPARKPE
jgi:hypothetical protein